MANRLPDEIKPLVNSMTAWQRNQWARAGYPIETAAVKRFTRMQKRKEGAHERGKQKQG
jgi:hypothetical protein